MNELAALTQLVINHFNRNELIQVLHDFGINHENLNGDTLASLARESVQYAKRHSCLPDFAKALAKRKPSVDFSPWGAPLPTENLHGVLRQLLNEAFSSGEILTIAFDVIPDLYGEVQSLPSKTGRVEMIIEKVVKHNATLQLMEYVRQNNVHQYSKYFTRIDKALSAHQNKEPEYIPSVPLTAEKPLEKSSENVSDALVLALRMYANGFNDNGELAKEALKTAGY